MSTFKFGFECLENESECPDRDHVEWLKSEEVVPSYQIKELDNVAAHAKMFACGEVEIGHVVLSNMREYIKKKGFNNIIELTDQNHSDLVTGIYEGGLKIWECTYDLIEYFEENPNTVNFEKLKVLDLGCGAGILGIYAFLKGGIVTFQDYNKEILEVCTIPNVLLNTEENESEKQIKKCRFYSGDWASFESILETSQRFDIILTSETVYNQRNYDKILSLIQNRLSDNGIAYVAAKTYYFGVGGGTRQFESVLKKYNLTSEAVWKTTIGVQREILKIKHKKYIFFYLYFAVKKNF